MRAIDGDALMKAMYHRAFETDGDTMWQSGCWVRYRAIEQTVKEQPTIEERKKGKWMKDSLCTVTVKHMQFAGVRNVNRISTMLYSLGTIARTAAHE